MQEIAETAVEYLANNPGIVYGAANLTTATVLLRSLYHQTRDTQPFVEEASELSDPELASEIADLDATFMVKDYGPEIEGSWEEAMIIYDGFVRPERNVRKQGFAEEAKNRPEDIGALLEDHSPNENSPFNIGILEKLGGKA